MKNYKLTYNEQGYLKEPIEADKFYIAQQEHDAVSVTATFPAMLVGSVKAYVEFAGGGDIINCENITVNKHTVTATISSDYLKYHYLLIGFEVDTGTKQIRFEPITLEVDRFVNPTGSASPSAYTVTVKIGNVTELEPGEAPFVTNSGTDKHPIFNFGIPKGDKGEKGDTGEQGIQGERGEAFVYSDFTSEQLEALRGPQGIQGIPGNDGYTPIKGVDYFTEEDMDSELSETSTKAVKNKVIKSALDKKVNKYEQNENILETIGMFDGYVLEGNGKTVASVSYVTTDYILIPAGESISLNGACRMYAIYDENKANISSEYNKNESTNITYTSTSDTDRYIRISFRKSYFDNIPLMLTMTDEPQLYADKKTVIEDNVYFSNVQNEELNNYIKKEPFNLLSGIRIFDNCYIAGSSGILHFADNYYTTDYIKIEKENSLAFTGIFSRFLVYDENLHPVKDTYNSSDRSNFVYTAPADATYYVRVSVRKTTASNRMIVRSSTVQPYTTNNDMVIRDKVLLNEYQIKQITDGTLYEYKNMLTNKKWVACGDSFTANGYTAEDGEHTFTEGLYTGQNMVYPFFIGRRCGIDVTNYAAGGMTLAHVDGYNNCFATSKYTTIPTDTDYITLYFGINDNHQSVPIGTADDTVNTTFCGAWNVVLEYLITNHPLAHIGIIVSNGTSKAFVEATKQMAVKWGIPYLDLATDNQVPLLLRTDRDDVCTTAKNLRLQSFRVSDTNSHPNNACHEYESYCIENWLMSL